MSNDAGNDRVFTEDIFQNYARHHDTRNEVREWNLSLRFDLQQLEYR